MTSARSTPRPRKVARRPYEGPRCATCGYVTLVTPCARAECPQWVIVCGGCEDVVERFIETDGRCPCCRIQ